MRTGSAEKSCDLIQPDDLRGVIKRYGGRARKGRGELCPPPPPGAVIDPMPGQLPRANDASDLPQALSIGGYALRVGVGSCPAADARRRLAVRRGARAET